MIGESNRAWELGNDLEGGGGSGQGHGGVHGQGGRGGVGGMGGPNNISRTKPGKRKCRGSWN